MSTPIASGRSERRDAEEGVFAYAKAVGASLDLEQVQSRVAQAVSDLLGGAQCLVLVYDEHAERLHAVAACGPDVGRLLGSWVSRSARAAVRDTLRQSRPPDLRALFVCEGGEVCLADVLDLRQAVVFPMAVQQRLIGLLLCLAPGQGGRYSARELRFGRHAAALAALAILNAREYRNLLRSQGRIEGVLARMSQMRDNERKVFSGLIHDDVLQAVAGAVYALEALRESVGDAALDDFDHIMRMLRLSMDTARKIIWDVRPAVLEGLGLEEALSTIADRIAVRGRSTVPTHVHGVGELGDVISSGVYKIGREALLNADRHAHANTIALSLTVEPADYGPVVKLVVEDDGIGFDSVTSRSAGHFGLVVMREQADSIGGDLSIESCLGRGTKVELTVPLVGVPLTAPRREAE